MRDYTISQLREECLHLFTQMTEQQVFMVVQVALGVLSERRRETPLETHAWIGGTLPSDEMWQEGMGQAFTEQVIHATSEGEQRLAAVRDMIAKSNQPRFVHFWSQQ